jgi:aminopeptidase N
MKIDNFYTATIYEKGAEIIRMLKVIVGDDAFKRGMDLYFDRWDGHATTVEAFVDCFAEISNQDMGQFFDWYRQAGTPQVEIEAHYDDDAQTLDLKVRQTTHPTPGQPSKKPLPAPIAFGLLDSDGAVLRDTEVLVLDKPEVTHRIEGLARRPVLSALRGFSAPVVLTTNAQANDAYVLLAADPDLFNRWEAGQNLARELILKRAAGAPDEVGEERFAQALGQALADKAAEPAFKALLISLPSEADLAMAMSPADPAAIHEARDALRARIAIHCGHALRDMHGALQGTGDFSPDAHSAGRRALRNGVIELLAAEPSSQNLDRAQGHYMAAANMTDAIGGLNALAQFGGSAFDEALAHFYDRWRDEPLVVDKWFAVQARDPSDQALGRVLGLTAHPAFDPKNPNRLRALVASFATGNPARFHDPSGAGYRFLADQILSVDGFNPSIAARLVEPLGGWRRYSPELAALMKAELDRIVAHPGLSKNVFELANKAAT